MSLSPAGVRKHDQYCKYPPVCSDSIFSMCVLRQPAATPTLVLSQPRSSVSRCSYGTQDPAHRRCFYIFMFSPTYCFVFSMAPGRYTDVHLLVTDFDRQVLPFLAEVLGRPLQGLASAGRPLAFSSRTRHRLRELAPVAGCLDKLCEECVTHPVPREPQE